MKTIFIGVIIVAGIILAILLGLNLYTNMQIQEKMDNIENNYVPVSAEDYALADSYQDRYSELMDLSCLGDFPSSFTEMEGKLKQHEKNLEKLLFSNQELYDLKYNMGLLALKYPQSAYFELYHECYDDEMWDVLYEQLQNEQGILTPEQKMRLQDFVSHQLAKCLEKEPELSCNSRIGEFTETGKLVLGYN